jgi:hypothetical protein
MTSVLFVTLLAQLDSVTDQKLLTVTFAKYKMPLKAQLQISVYAQLDVTLKALAVTGVMQIVQHVVDQAMKIALPVTLTLPKQKPLPTMVLESVLAKKVTHITINSICV